MASTPNMPRVAAKTDPGPRCGRVTSIGSDRRENNGSGPSRGRYGGPLTHSSYTTSRDTTLANPNYVRPSPDYMRRTCNHRVRSTLSTGCGFLKAVEFGCKP